MKQFSTRAQVATLGLVLTVMALSACESAVAPTVTSTPMTAKGGFSGTIDNADWTVSYEGIKATVTMAHRINKDPGGLACVPSLAIELAKPDGSCKLELNYEAGFAGEGLLLKEVKFHAKAGIYQDGVVIHSIPCEGWASEPAKGAVVYTSTAVEGSMTLNPLAQPEAGMTKATLRSMKLAPAFNGPTTMVFKGRKFTMDLSKISFEGDIVSEGSDTVQCVKTFHEFPKWELKDINPGSAGYNTTYGLDAFKGKKVVVALVSDWCNSCRSQTQLMQKMQDEANASGHSDTVMVMINDKQKSDPSQLTKLAKDIPIFQDVAGVDAWVKMNESHAGEFNGSAIRNSGYGFAKNGAAIMYFAPNGTGALNLTDYRTAVQTVINAKDDD